MGGGGVRGGGGNYVKHTLFIPGMGVIINIVGPPRPSNWEKPPAGTRGEPVANLSKRAFSSSLRLRTSFQNQTIHSSDDFSPRYCNEAKERDILDHCHFNNTIIKVYVRGVVQRENVEARKTKKINNLRLEYLEQYSYHRVCTPIIHTDGWHSRYQEREFIWFEHLKTFLWNDLRGIESMNKNVSNLIY